MDTKAILATVERKKDEALEAERAAGCSMEAARSTMEAADEEAVAARDVFMLHEDEFDRLVAAREEAQLLSGGVRQLIEALEPRPCPAAHGIEAHAVGDFPVTCLRCRGYSTFPKIEDQCPHAGLMPHTRGSLPDCQYCRGYLQNTADEAGQG
jgi:hypothetical protein